MLFLHINENIPQDLHSHTLKCISSIVFHRVVANNIFNIQFILRSLITLVTNPCFRNMRSNMLSMPLMFQKTSRNFSADERFRPVLYGSLSAAREFSDSPRFSRKIHYVWKNSTHCKWGIFQKIYMSIIVKNYCELKNASN